MSVEFSRKQLDIIASALDLYSRILCGQFEEIVNLTKSGYVRTSSGNFVDKNELDRLTTAIAMAKEAIGFSPTASHGIYSPYVLNSAREALSIVRTICKS